MEHNRKNKQGADGTMPNPKMTHILDVRSSRLLRAG